MKKALISFIKSILPSQFVLVVRNWRRQRRQNIRFQINKGRDYLKEMNVEGENFSIFINPYLNGGVDDSIYTSGFWEPEITSLIKRHLSKGDTFLDIGANIGIHTLLGASLVGSAGKVMAFEPLPRLYEQTKKSLAENKFDQVKVYNVALAERAGVGKLSLVDENIGASSLQSVSEDREVNEVVEVQQTVLDSYSDEFKSLDLIKIDIEGGEYEALKGGEKLIRRYLPVIVLEFSPHVYEKDRSGKSLELYNYLSSLGYRIEVIDIPDMDILAKLNMKDYADLHTNLICLPNKVT